MPSEATEQQAIELIIPKEITSPETVQQLKAAAMPFFERASPLCVAARELVVTDINDAEGMAKAKGQRAILRKIRTESQTVRRALKADSLAKGGAIDAIFNGLRDALAEHEAHLAEQEEYAERAEANRRIELGVERDGILTEIGADPAHYNTESMTEEAFVACVAGIKAAARDAMEAAERAEAERIAKEKADAEEREAQRLENERLKTEADKREKKITRDRAAHQKKNDELRAKATKERETREALERKERDRKQAEKKRLDAERAKERKAANAPDRTKLRLWAGKIRALERPDMTTDEAGRIVGDAHFKLLRVADAICVDAEEL